MVQERSNRSRVVSQLESAFASRTVCLWFKVLRPQPAWQNALEIPPQSRAGSAWGKNIPCSRCTDSSTLRFFHQERDRPVRRVPGRRRVRPYPTPRRTRGWPRPAAGECSHPPGTPAPCDFPIARRPRRADRRQSRARPRSNPTSNEMRPSEVAMHIHGSKRSGRTPHTQRAIALSRRRARIEFRPPLRFASR